MDNIMLSQNPALVITLILSVEQTYNVPLSMEKLPVNLKTLSEY